MKHNYKSIQLLRLFYSELDLFDRLETEYSLSEDIKLKQEFKEISKTIDQISEISYSPSKNSIESILAYSKM